MRRKISWYLFFSRGQHPVLANFLFWRAFEYFPKFFNLPRVQAYRRDIQNSYFDRREYIKLITGLKRQLQQQSNYITRRVALAEHLFTKTQSFSKSLYRIDWSSRSDKEIFAACRRLFKYLTINFVYVYWPIWIEEAASGLIKHEFINKFGHGWQTQWFAVTRPKQLTNYQKLRLAMLKTATAWKSGTIKTPQVKRRCGELAANYGYLKTYIFRVRSYTSTELFSELKTFKKQTFSTLNHWQKQRITEQHIRQNILKSLSPKIRNIALAMTKVVYLREQRVGWWGKITTAGYPLITECARRLGLTYDQFFQLTETEFLNQRFRLASINKRSNGYAFVAIGDKATIKLQKFQPPRSSNLKVVKGVTVSPGTVQGPVQFADAYTFPNLKRGAILVTAMTTPDSVPYLKRVKAIVTDEGGATAHAAIIARELKIPCVIGTKIATKVFHSGDIVEVRGVEGIVKLIKKFNQTGL